MASIAPRHIRNGLDFGLNQQIVLDALDLALSTGGQPSPGHTGMPTGGQVTTYGVWRGLALEHLGQTTAKKRTQAFNDAAEALITGKHVGRHGEFVWKS